MPDFANPYDGPYRGRFAPSPTGPLHHGSLITALASYLDARANDGTWLVRMEDLDPPREQAGAATRILRSLEAHGLYWDESVLWQSQRNAAYLDALRQLDDAGTLFACHCSRQQTDDVGNCGGCDTPGTDTEAAVRVRVASDYQAHWLDLWQGDKHWPLGENLHDFVLRRKDSLFAYQLAVVVDDACQQVSHVIRGCDLLDSTPRQLWLQHLLGYPVPRYGHLPLLNNSLGQKLSKQNHAPALDDTRAPDNLRLALQLLGQAGVDGNDCDSILTQALRQWQPAAIPRGVAFASTLG